MENNNENIYIKPNKTSIAEEPYDDINVSELVPEEYLRYLSPTKVVEHHKRHYKDV